MEHAATGDGIPFQKRFRSFIFRPSLVKKILFGYLFLTALVIIISVFTLSSLERLNKVNESIVQSDVPLIETSEEMIDSLFEQELYARRYFILNSSEMLELFREKSREFDAMVEKIRSFSSNHKERADRLISLHAEYTVLLLNAPAAPQKYEGQIKKKQDELVALINKISSRAKRAQNRKMLKTKHIGTITFRVAGVICGTGIILTIGAVLLITRNISRSISQLKHATEEISEGRFEYTSDTSHNDELGDLSVAFTEMAKRLKALEEIYRDASPLTRLPGGVAIENRLAKKLDAGTPAAFCFIDLDNFKAFNDRYSYARGNEVIKATARILEETIAESGTGDDFIGHIGGDDFVFITTPESYPEICSRIIERFDNMIVTFYESGDLKRGFIISRNRQGMEMRFPVMTISIAVINNQKGKPGNPVQLGEIASELKAYAKSIPASVCVVDRRQAKDPKGISDRVVQFPRKSV